MPAMRWLLLQLVREKRPRKCEASVKRLRRRLTEPPDIANDHPGLSDGDRTAALTQLSAMCLACPKVCPNAGGADVVPFRRRA